MNGQLRESSDSRIMQINRMSGSAEELMEVIKMYNTGAGKTFKLVIKLTDKPMKSNCVLLALPKQFEVKCHTSHAKMTDDVRRQHNIKLLSRNACGIIVFTNNGSSSQRTIVCGIHRRYARRGIGAMLWKACLQQCPQHSTLFS